MEGRSSMADHSQCACTSSVVQVWFRCSSGMMQIWFNCGSRWFKRGRASGAPEAEFARNTGLLVRAGLSRSRALCRRGGADVAMAIGPLCCARTDDRSGSRARMGPLAARHGALPWLRASAPLVAMERPIPRAPRRCRRGQHTWEPRAETWIAECMKSYRKYNMGQHRNPPDTKWCHAPCAPYKAVRRARRPGKAAVPA